ncbi:jg2589, partial [Pararge aegeria aegeria]
LFFIAVIACVCAYALALPFDAQFGGYDGYGGFGRSAPQLGYYGSDYGRAAGGRSAPQFWEGLILI